MAGSSPVAALRGRCEAAVAALAGIGAPVLAGRVRAVAGQAVVVAGLDGAVSLGDRLRLCARDGVIGAEVVALQRGTTRLLCRNAADGIGLATPALLDLGQREAALPVCDLWLGRVIDADGAPLDGRGALPVGGGRHTRPGLSRLRAPPPAATSRARLGPRLDLGVAALDLFATCRAGQRLGLFAASGVGKSTLLGMLARNTACDVVVLGLIGERGREVREFLEDELGPAGVARCVTVVATSDETALRRRDAARAAMAVAEYFRDQGRHVLLLMDSVTRYCTALRDIALEAGEPPASRGWPASVFAELPRLLERAGPGPNLGPGPGLGEAAGAITAFFTVLVEGDDHDEPVADAARGFLDGHVVLDRRIAEAGRYPAVDVLRSLSRSVPGCLDAAEWRLVRQARAVLARAAELADLVRLGAYVPGRDAEADAALAMAPRLEAMLNQDRASSVSAAEAFADLAALLT